MFVCLFPIGSTNLRSQTERICDHALYAFARSHASSIARPARAGEQAFRALYKELVATNNAHGLNERMRVQSLMESRDLMKQMKL
jgi:hypothetical protein